MTPRAKFLLGLFVVLVCFLLSESCGEQPTARSWERRQDLIIAALRDSLRDCKNDVGHSFEYDFLNGEPVTTADGDTIGYCQWGRAFIGDISWDTLQASGNDTVYWHPGRLK